LHRLCVVLAARFEAVRTPAVGDGHGHARVDPLIRWSKRVRFDHSALQFDIRDALAPGGLLLCELPTGTRIGASSVRRGVQLAASHPHLECVPFRDNANRRLDKLAAGEVDVLLLAVERIGRTGVIAEVLSTEAMCPPIGAGVLAFRCCEADPPRSTSSAL
jgi:Porphobilinogen deaminase